MATKSVDFLRFWGPNPSETAELGIATDKYSCGEQNALREYHVGLGPFLFQTESPKMWMGYPPPPTTLAQALDFPSTGLCLTIFFLVVSNRSFCGQKYNVTRLCFDCRGKRGLHHVFWYVLLPTPSSMLFVLMWFSALVNVAIAGAPVTYTRFTGEHVPDDYWCFYSILMPLRGNVSAPGARRASFVTRALPVVCCR